MVVSVENNNLFHRMFNGYPIELYWEGWRTDTHTLQRRGWTFSADEYRRPDMPSHIQITLAAVSPDRVVAVKGSRILALSWTSPYSSIDGRFWGEAFHMQQFTCRDRVTYSGGLPEELASMVRLRPVDITLPSEPVRVNDFHFRDLKIFHYKEAPQAQQIVIPKDSVDDCLNRILSLQYVDRKPSKNGLILPEQQPIIQAQIYSLSA